MGYDLNFKYIKSKDLLIADALSRSPVTTLLIRDWNHRLGYSRSKLTGHLKEIAEETTNDNFLQ